MDLSPRHVILLHILHLTPRATVITLVDEMAPFYPPAHPPSQQSVRDQLKALRTAGLVEIAHKGKPRTFLRTAMSYRVLPNATRDANAPKRHQE